MKKGQGEGLAFAFISFGVNPQMRGRELRWGVFIPVLLSVLRK